MKRISRKERQRGGFSFKQSILADKKKNIFFSFSAEANKKDDSTSIFYPVKIWANPSIVPAGAAGLKELGPTIYSLALGGSESGEDPQEVGPWKIFTNRNIEEIWERARSDVPSLREHLGGPRKIPGSRFALTFRGLRKRCEELAIYFREELEDGLKHYKSKKVRDQEKIHLLLQKWHDGMFWKRQKLIEEFQALSKVRQEAQRTRD